MSEAEEQVRRLYGTEELRPLFAAARRRLEERDLVVGGSVMLRDPSENERMAVGRVLGAARLGAHDVRVGLADLDAALCRQVTGLGLADVLVALGGPLVARRDERQRARATRASVFDAAIGHAAVARHQGLETWLTWLRRRGILTRLPPDQARSTLGQALNVLAALPAQPTSLPVFAGRVTGSTHALDRGTALAVLVDRALAFLAGAEPTHSRRELWERFGIALDAVSSSAIALNLRPAGGRLANLLGAAADIGEPVPVTLRMLRGLDALDVCGATVSLCENRSVIEAVADALGPRATPLICLSGEPTSAGRELLRLLRAGGARLRYHGDFDPEGIAIANSIIGPDVAPWRYDTNAYLAAIAATPMHDELGGRLVEARWDARLADAMAVAGARIYEEHVLPDLVADLTEPLVPHTPIAVAGSPDEPPEDPALEHR